MRTATTLLLVDDEPAVLLLTKTLLERAGYRVAIASGPHTAIDALRGGRPDGLIVDIRLPGMLGSDLLQLLRSPDTRHTPAIAITGDANLAEEDILACGFCAVLRKPFTSEQLLQAVEYYIG